MDTLAAEREARIREVAELRSTKDAWIARLETENERLRAALADLRIDRHSAMRFYRVDLWTETESSSGYEFFASRAEADKRVADHGREVNCPDDERRAAIEEVEIEPTKTGILAALNRYAGHPDNG